MRAGFMGRLPLVPALCALLAAAGSGLPVTAQGLTVSGILDSAVSMKAGAGDAPAFSYGFEEYANIRMQARVRDRAVFYGAVNLIAAAGDAAKNAALLGLARGSGSMGLSPSAFTYGENYLAGFELERLYFRLNGEYLDFDGGLLRLPFGYGQVWGSSDFLNPKNPLYPDARPRAVLGAGLSWYPADSLKLLGFGAAPRNPFAETGEGGLMGLSMDQHWDRASVQALYAFETPRDGSRRGIHRAGMSVKADVELGLLADLLYTYNQEADTGVDGLSLSLGLDYSFFEGKLITLAEYLYNGETSSTAVRGGGGFSNEQYLYTGLTWLINDYTTTGLALISGFDDVSFTTILSLEHELFQGCSLSLSGQIPLDRDRFSDNGGQGELGPAAGGSYFNLNTKLRLRF
ncbi:MAG: hypothetical protein LBK62_10725 [Treponema sp.]|jgi:hypothetical protein|nr:hypothetical protein [Treponema sp.]